MGWFGLGFLARKEIYRLCVNRRYGIFVKLTKMLDL